MSRPVQALYLEDDPRDADLVRDKLQQTGRAFDLRIVRDRGEYEAAIAETDWELILSDYDLPDYDGLAALALARQQHPDTPFIITSGALGEEQAVDCVLQGATDYVLKQRLERLVPAVNRALAEAEERRKRRQAETALQISEERYRDLVENLGDIVFELDEQARVSYTSPAAKRILGYTFEEIRGLRFTELVHSDDIPGAEAAYRGMLAGSQVLCEARLKRKDGTHCWVAISMRLVPGTPHEEGGGRLIGTMKDISERKHAEEQLAQQLKILKALYAGTQRLTGSLSQTAVADESVRTAVDVLDASLAWLIRAEEGDHPELLAQFPADHPHRFLASEQSATRRSERGLAALAMRSGHPQVLDAASSGGDALSSRISPHDAHGFRSAMAVPLISGGHTFGALQLFSDQGDFFTPERLEMFQTFAHQAAIALENARLFEENRGRLSRITALRNIDSAIAGSLDLRVTYGVALDQIVSQVGVDAAAILQLKAYTNTLEYVAGRGFRTHGIERTRIHLGEGHPGRAALERSIVHVSRFSTGADECSRAELLAEEGFVAYYAVPMLAKGKLRGVLEIFQRSLGEDNSEWRDYLETLAGQVAVAIDSASLFADLERKHAQLIQSYDATIEGWARALSLKEEVTEEHSQRVTELTVQLARMMGMSDEEIVHVWRGALLHDIGKIGIPDSILLKPGKLTEEEWQVMRRHPVHAFEMLSPIEYLRPAVDIPYCHHEKWDGSGYPRGLKGEEIPFSARIFAVVDVWEALMRDRPYRKAWSREKTLKYIRQESGKSFDPAVVEQFLKLIGG